MEQLVENLNKEVLELEIAINKSIEELLSEANKRFRNILFSVASNVVGDEIYLEAKFITTTTGFSLSFRHSVKLTLALKI